MIQSPVAKEKTKEWNFLLESLPATTRYAIKTLETSRPAQAHYEIVEISTRAQMPGEPTPGARGLAAKFYAHIKGATDKPPSNLHHYVEGENNNYLLFPKDEKYVLAFKLHK